MPRRRLNADHVLTPTERSRRHRDRLRGLAVPAAPAAQKRVGSAAYLEELLGCKLPTLEDVLAAAAGVGIPGSELAPDDAPSEEAA
jgi:hypothetical protein